MAVLGLNKRNKKRNKNQQKLQQRKLIHKNKEGKNKSFQLVSFVVFVLTEAADANQSVDCIGMGYAILAARIVVDRKCFVSDALQPVCYLSVHYPKMWL